ncbi:OmpA family protein [Dactylosporangium sp. CA-092794]|uniref:OmpA family protein n=1 Tax=Dactylosporangium sp. CA-092794 TaxID=3239929 RepID=UPI003D911507
MRRLSFSAAALVAAGLLFSGCADEPAPQPQSTGLAEGPAGCPVPTGPISIAYGARANNPVPELPDGVLAAIDKAAYAGSEITAFAVSGTPRDVDFQLTFHPQAKNPGAQRAEQDQLNQDLREQLGAIHAGNDEANPLATVDLAGRRAGPGGTVVLVDSGLQTVPPLDFHDANLIGADPQEVAAALKQHGQLPTLKGRTVVLVGVGYTADPQPALDTRQRNNLLDIWRAIAGTAEAACVGVYDQAGGDKPASDLPHVSKIEFPVEKPPVPCGTTVLANSGRVGFKKNVAVFIDQQAAEQAIGEIADAMRKGNQHAKLIGTTATDQSVEFRAKLSLQRANAVKDVLIRLGIPAERIETVGAGTTYKTHVNDIGPGGTLLPGPAAQNRSVVVELSCPNGG